MAAGNPLTFQLPNPLDPGQQAAVAGSIGGAVASGVHGVQQGVQSITGLGATISKDLGGWILRGAEITLGIVLVALALNAMVRPATDRLASTAVRVASVVK
jgi:hypothetical protein